MLNLGDIVKIVDNEANQEKHKQFGDDYQIGARMKVIDVTEDGYRITSEMVQIMQCPVFTVGGEDVEFIAHEEK